MAAGLAMSELSMSKASMCVLAKVCLRFCMLTSDTAASSVTYLLYNGTQGHDWHEEGEGRCRGRSKAAEAVMDSHQQPEQHAAESIALYKSAV